MSEETIHIYNLPQRSLLYDGLKRLLDIVAAVLLLVVFAVPLLVIALAIRCTSAGSVFYRQLRVGRYNRQFFVYKFRTMYVNSDRKGPLITSSDDCRITPLGRLLRNNKLDELPQLFNVIKGDMSLVGPRPQVPRFVDEFRPEHRAIVLAVRPGITGPTQLMFRCEEQMLEGRTDRERYYIEYLLPIKCELDVEYVQQRSLGKDLRVLWDTASIVMSGMFRRIIGRPAMEHEESFVVKALRKCDEIEASKIAETHIEEVREPEKVLVER
jgi:lipopolysaccharide/colanic/teichoic acid biosynthesis glycosyltransferase